MRVESTRLPQAAQNHSKVHGSGKASPGNAAEKAKPAASGTESLAAAGPANTEQTAKTAPKGLSNAIARLEAKENSGKGIEQALEMLTRNLSRYQPAPPPAETDSALPATDATATDGTAASGAESTPASTTTPTTGS